MDSSFVPKNNIEEAILLLMILLRKVSLKIIKWDPDILDHLSYTLSVCNGLDALSTQLEELPQGIIDNKERFFLLALCYHGQGDDFSALNLLKSLYKNEGSGPHCGPALLLASKIYGKDINFFEEGVNTGKQAIQESESKCDEMVGVANYLLGISLSGHCKFAISDLERVEKQSESISYLEKANGLTGMNDSRIVYNLSLENAEQRKLETALGYVKRLIKLEGGSNIKAWILMARILSGQKRFLEAETVINAGLEQTGIWDQGELLRTKARLQVAQGKIKDAIQTYTQILAVLQVHSKSFRSQKINHEVNKQCKIVYILVIILISSYLRMNRLIQLCFISNGLNRK